MIEIAPKVLLLVFALGIVAGAFAAVVLDALTSRRQFRRMRRDLEQRYLEPKHLR